MKIELITRHELLNFYIAQNYPESIVLVINLNGCASFKEIEDLEQELADFGYRPPEAFVGLGYLTIEILEEVAIKLVEKHVGDTIWLGLYKNGKLIKENV